MEQTPDELYALLDSYYVPLENDSTVEADVNQQASALQLYYLPENYSGEEAQTYALATLPSPSDPTTSSKEPLFLEASASSYETSDPQLPDLSTKKKSPNASQLVPHKKKRNRKKKQKLYQMGPQMDPLDEEKRQRALIAHAYREKKGNEKKEMLENLTAVTEQVEQLKIEIKSRKDYVKMLEDELEKARSASAETGVGLRPTEDY